MENKSLTRKLLASGTSDTASHKRLIALVSIIMLVALSILSAFGYSASTEFGYIFASLAGCESMLTVAEKLGKRNGSDF